MIFKRMPAALEGFPMGSRSMDDARPVTRVVIEEPYWMAAFPTTQLQWQVGLKEFKAAGFSEYKTLANLYPGFTGPYLPMERINWTDCQTWIECFNRLPQVQELLQKDSPTPQSFGLPYECEWEWACRAVRGTDGRYQACTWEFNGLNHFGDGEPAIERYRVLAQPKQFEHIKEKARATVVAKYELSACLKHKLAWLSSLMNARR